MPFSLRATATGSMPVASLNKIPMNDRIGFAIRRRYLASSSTPASLFSSQSRLLPPLLAAAPVVDMEQPPQVMRREVGKAAVAALACLVFLGHGAVVFTTMILSAPISTAS